MRIGDHFHFGCGRGGAAGARLGRQHGRQLCGEVGNRLVLNWHELDGDRRFGPIDRLDQLGNFLDVRRIVGDDQSVGAGDRHDIRARLREERLDQRLDLLGVGVLQDEGLRDGRRLARRSGRLARPDRLRDIR